MACMHACSIILNGSSMMLAGATRHNADLNVHPSWIPKEMMHHATAASLLIKLSTRVKRRVDACSGNSNFLEGSAGSNDVRVYFDTFALRDSESNSRGLPPKACMYRYRTLSARKMGCARLLYVLKNHGYRSLTRFKLSSSVQSLQ